MFNPKPGRVSRFLATLCIPMVLATSAGFLNPNPVFAAGPAAQTSPRFILKLRDSVELSATPSVRRLEKEGEFITEVLQTNRTDARWLRAGTLGTHILQWSDSVREGDRQALLNRLASDPRVEFVEADQLMSGMAVPNDANFSGQWALQSVANRSGARFDKAWDLIRGSASVVVAVVDTGVVYQTPELYGRLLAGYDFISDLSISNDGDGRDADASDPGDWVSEADKSQSVFDECQVSNSSWHGTFIAGQIAGVTQNLDGIAGGDWNAKVLPVRVSGKCKAYSSDLYDGMLWSVGLDVPGVPRNPTPASIVSVSLGSPSTCSGMGQNVVNRLQATGALLVASAGNGGGDSYLPANCQGAISVAALDRDGTRAFYSAIGPTVHIAAPGGYYNGLLGVSNSGLRGPESPRISSNTGTSFAAPLVAAAAALVKAVNPALSGAEIRQILLSNAQPFLSNSGKKCVAGQGKAVCDCSAGVCGSGMLDAHASVVAARSSKPLANIAVGLDGKDLSKLTLSAENSSAVAGRSVASWSWEQLAGEPLMQTASAEPRLELTLPSTSTDLVFRLLVTDSAGESHASLAAFRISRSAQQGASPAALVTPSSGGSAPPAASSGSSGGSVSQAGTPVASASGSGGGGGGGGALQLHGLLGLALLLAWVRVHQTFRSHLA